MPKSLVVDPAITRHPGTVRFQPVAINAYDVSIEDEVTRLGRDALEKHQRIGRQQEGRDRRRVLQRR